MIPRTIHQIWLGSPVPTKFLANMVAWQDLNPGWKYQLWTAPPPNMYNEDLYWDAPMYVKPDAVWQMRADLLRYEILYREGGFYADTDTAPLRPIGDLLDGRREFAVAESQEFIGNTYLASEPGNPIFEVLIKDQKHNADKYRCAAAGVVTGPQYLTPIWSTMGGHVDHRTELWFPYSWEHVRRYQEKNVAIPEDAYAIHGWEHSVTRRRRSNRVVRQTKEAQ